MNKEEYFRHRRVITDMIEISNRAAKQRKDPQMAVSAATAANQLSQTLQNLMDSDLQTRKII